MQIDKTANDEFQIKFTPSEGRTLVNCMKVAITEIMPTEFQTRIAANAKQISAIVSNIEAALK